MTLCSNGIDMAFSLWHTCRVQPSLCIRWSMCNQRRLVTWLSKLPCRVVIGRNQVALENRVRLDECKTQKGAVLSRDNTKLFQPVFVPGPPLALRDGSKGLGLLPYVHGARPYGLAEAILAYYGGLVADLEWKQIGTVLRYSSLGVVTVHFFVLCSANAYCCNEPKCTVL